MSTSKSKDEQLARIRRNQQRCRERKRAHVAELERQVDALQAKIRQCEPCESQTPPACESALEQAQRENHARRELLLALGFDDDIQERFINSSVKRQAILNILHNGDEQSPPPNSSDHLTPIVAGTASQYMPSPHVNPPASPINTVTMEPIRAPPTLLPFATSQVSGHASPVAEWSLAPEMLDLSLLPEWTLPDDSAWPPISTIEVNGTQAVAEAGMSAPDADPATTFLVNNIGPGNTGPAEHHFSPSHDVERMERCFLDTVVQVQPGENRTVCSIALAMIFRNNRKGLSMGELQRRLLPGMKGSSSFSSECSIEDSILINVLADIST